MGECKRYDTMGFESVHGVWVRWADHDALAAQVATLQNDIRELTCGDVRYTSTVKALEANSVAHAWRADAAEGRVKALTEERDAAKADAARYRLLRYEGTPLFRVFRFWTEPHSQTNEPTTWQQQLLGDALDEALDAALYPASREAGKAHE